ncbi:hypothetical protein ADIAL_1815 [Alkalibacterium sp. AK22]|nr:hypothetical protein ADIAL_1815 [Alkalibacterium sp. AK22]
MSLPERNKASRKLRKSTVHEHQLPSEMETFEKPAETKVTPLLHYVVRKD